MNVREVMAETTPLFIKHKQPDKMAAIKRYESTLRNFEKWHGEINDTNTRELPAELVGLYENACIILCQILEKERLIALSK